MVKPIPDTSPRVIPTLVCRDPEAAIEFCEKVLNAEVRVRRSGPDGKTITSSCSALSCWSSGCAVFNRSKLEGRRKPPVPSFVSILFRFANYLSEHVIKYS